MSSVPGTRKPRVLVIVLNYNGAAHTLECLRHLRAQTATLETLVLDNGSADDSAEVLAEAVRGLGRFLPLGRNLGFAAGMNVGLRQAVAGNYEYAWLLNNDAFAAPDCLERLVRAMERSPGWAMVSPRLLDADGKEQHAGGHIDWSTGWSEILRSGEFNRGTRWGTWVTGTAPLLRTVFLRKAGFFDPRFFAYWEDIDLSVRIWKAGGELAAVPEACVLHLGGATSGGLTSPFVTFLYIRNTVLFLRKHVPPRRRLAVLLNYAADQMTRAAWCSLQGKDGIARTIVAALVASLHQPFGCPRSLRTNRLVERLALRHPWRLSRILAGVARLCPGGVGGKALPPLGSAACPGVPGLPA